MSKYDYLARELATIAAIAILFYTPIMCVKDYRATQRSKNLANGEFKDQPSLVLTGTTINGRAFFDANGDGKSDYDCNLKHNAPIYQEDFKVAKSGKEWLPRLDPRTLAKVETH